MEKVANPQSSEPVPQEVKTSAPQEPLPTSKNWRKIIFSVLGILLALGSFSYLGYQYAIQKQSPPVTYPTISPTPLPTTDPTANWKTYQFSRSKEYKLSEYTFSIKYPREWTIKESSLRPDELAYKVQFFSPGKTYIDLNIGPSENIDTFENQVANAKGYFESPKEENLGIEGFSQSVKISGKVKPSANPEGISYYTERVFLQKNQKIISLILTQGLNENYTEKFNQILSTFKFLPAPDSPTSGVERIVITEKDSGKSFSFNLRTQASLRLSNQSLWDAPQVNGRAVRLVRVDYIRDPGFSEWNIEPVEVGRVKITSSGVSNCVAGTPCPSITVQFEITITVSQ